MGVDLEMFHFRRPLPRAFLVEKPLKSLKLRGSFRSLAQREQEATWVTCISVMSIIIPSSTRAEKHLLRLLFLHFRHRESSLRGEFQFEGFLGAVGSSVDLGDFDHMERIIVQGVADATVFYRLGCFYRLATPVVTLDP